MFTSMYFSGYVSANILEMINFRVPAGPGNPGKSLNFKESFSRPGESWNSDVGPGKSWKTELSLVFY